MEGRGARGEGSWQSDGGKLCDFGAKSMICLLFVVVFVVFIVLFVFTFCIFCILDATLHRRFWLKQVCQPPGENVCCSKKQAPEDNSTQTVSPRGTRGVLDKVPKCRARSNRSEGNVFVSRLHLGTHVGYISSRWAISG